MTGDAFGDDAPWTPPELAPRLVRVLASGRADALAGPLPPRRARRHRGPHPPRRRDRRERPERDPPPPLRLNAAATARTAPTLPCASAVLHLPELQAPLGRPRRLRGLLDAGGPVPQLRVRLPLRAPRGLLPRPATGSSSATARPRARGRPRRLRADGVPRRRPPRARRRRGALALRPSPIEVVREWGVRKLGAAARDPDEGGPREAVTVDFFPAYDEDGGMLVALTPRCDARLDPDLWRATARSSPSARRAPSPRRACGRPRRAATRRRRTARPAPGRRDARASSAEDDLAPPGDADRVGARAVDRRPDDLRARARAPSTARRAAARGPRPAPRRRRARRRPRGSRTRSTRGTTGLPIADVPRRASSASATETGAGTSTSTDGRGLGDDRVPVEQHGASPSPATARPSGRPSGGGRRSVTSTSSASTNAARRPHA